MADGLLSTGRAARWTVTIEEHIAGDDDYSVWVQSPIVYLQFNLRDVTRLGALVQFLRVQGPQDRSFEFQECLGGDLAFIHHDGSLLIRLNIPGTQMFNVRLDFSEADAFATALEDALEVGTSSTTSR